MPDTTRYGSSLSADYSTIFGSQNRFNWLVQILEEYTVNTLPTDRNITIMDAACGVGMLCWRLARMGYLEVVGVDVSASQIRACRSIASTLPANLSFIQKDAKLLHECADLASRFDVVNANWLYDTAANEDELLKMAQAVRHCLKPGGVHKGMEVNFDIKASGPTELEDYGVSLMPDKPVGYRPKNCETIRAYLYAGTETELRGERFMITDVTYFTEAAYRSAFLNAGFQDVRFHPPQEWKLGDRWRQLDLPKFRTYIAVNPEMIAFTATA